MPLIVCNICDRPTDTWVCNTCIQAYAHQLTQIPHLMHQLDLVAGKRTRYSRRATTREQFALPINITAINLQHRIRNHLTTTIRHLTEPTNHTPPKNTIPQMLKWLTTYHQAIPLRPEGPDIVAELQALTNRANTLIDCPPNLHYAGECPNCNLAIFTPKDSPWHRCPCGNHLNTETLTIERMQRAHDTLLTINEIKTLSGIPRWTLRSWVDRNRLTPRGKRGDKPTYRYGDALELNNQRVALGA